VPVEDWKVTVYNKDGSGIRTELTDENGIVIVPPLSEAPISKPTPTPTPDAEATPLPGVDTTPTPDTTETPSTTDTPNATDKPNTTETPTPSDNPSATLNPSEPTPTPDIGDGAVVENKNYNYRVYVWDNDGAITEFGLVKLQDNGSLEIELPSSKTLTADNKVNIKVINENDGSPIKGITVNVTDNAGDTASDITNSNGIAVVPVSDTDITDANGNLYNIVVEDTTAKIENAYVEIVDGKINITLPETNTLTTSNQTTVTVTDKDGAAVKDMSVTVTDTINNTATKSTDANGKITVPVKTSSSSGGGSSSGSSSGSSGGGGGSSSTSSTSYTVKVVDKNGKTVNVTKSVKDDKITLTLPNGTVLDGSNYYTITVTNRSGKVKSDIDVTLKDKKDNSANGTTDANGQLVLPATEHKLYVVGYNDGEFKPEGNMTRAEAAAIFTRNIAERKGETITNRKSSFTDVDTNLWYNQYISYLEKYDIIEGYENGEFKPEAQITRAEFITMCTRFYEMFDEITSSKKNIFTDVENNHWASSYIYSAVGMNWIEGYADGTFKPDNNITCAEVVAIVNRVTDRSADTEYVNKNLSSLNRFADLTDKSYWAYYDIVEAANTHSAVTSSDSETWVK
jgi:hypothetical protein